MHIGAESIETAGEIGISDDILVIRIRSAIQLACFFENFVSGPTMNQLEKEAIRKRMRRLAWLMDSSITVPGTNTTIGVDPLLGLFPWFGDTIGAVLSSFIMAEAARLGAPKSVLLKMAFNIAIDALVGAVPFAGDLFDFVWKANLRNVQVLEDYLERPHHTVVTSRLFVIVLILLLGGFVIFVGLMGFLALRALWIAVSGS